jgi:hypothetical protein
LADCAFVSRNFGSDIWEIEFLQFLISPQIWNITGTSSNKLFWLKRKTNQARSGFPERREYNAALRLIVRRFKRTLTGSFLVRRYKKSIDDLLIPNTIISCLFILFIVDFMFRRWSNALLRFYGSAQVFGVEINGSLRFRK